MKVLVVVGVMGGVDFEVINEIVNVLIEFVYFVG